MKLKKLLKVLRPYQYIKIIRIENDAMKFGEIIHLKNFPKDCSELEYTVVTVHTTTGLVNNKVVDYLNIIIVKEVTKID